MAAARRKISFVIPCYGSEKTIAQVIQSIQRTVKGSDDYEIICVNDSSPDQVQTVLEANAERDSRIKVIRLAKNFGQHNALMAGYRHTTGDIVVSLDDDGQTPAEECYKLIDAINDDCDVVYARYQDKKHNTFRNLGSKIAAWMGRIMINYPKDFYGSSYFACKKYVINEISRYENPYTFIAGLIFRSTNRIKNVDVEHRERMSGHSGYSFSKLLALWLNGFTAFSVKPLRIASFVGFVCAITGFIFGLVTVIRKLLEPAIAIGYSSMMAVLLFVSGVLMIMLGLIGEYIGRIYISLNNSPQYVIRDTCNIDDE